MRSPQCSVFSGTSMSDIQYRNTVSRKNNLTTPTHKEIIASLQTSMLYNQQLFAKNDRPKSTWISKSKSSKEIERLHKQEQINKISFKHESYKDAPFLPGWQFFKTLCALCGDTPVRLNLPTTLVSGFGFESPCLFYTNSSGILKVRRHANQELIDIFMDKLDSHNLENRKGVLRPLAIAKMPNSEFNRVLMKMSEVRKIWHDKERLDMVLQQYIFPKGRKTCKVRLIYELEKVRIFIVSNSFRLDGKADADPYRTHTEGMRSTASNTIHTINTIKTAAYDRYTNVNLSEDNGKTHWSNIEDSYIRSDKEDRDLPFRRKNPFKSSVPSKINSKTVLGDIDYSEKEAGMSETKLSKRGKNYHKSTSNFEKSSSIKNPSVDLESYLMNVSSSPIPRKQNPNSRNLTRIEDEDAEDIQISFGLLKKLRQLYCIDLTQTDYVNIYESKNHKLFTTIMHETKRLIDYIDKFTLKQSNVRLNRVVCDFCEDKDGNWWFLKLKSVKFGVAKGKKKLVIKTQKFECPGEYCKVTVGIETREYNSNVFKVSPRIVRPHSRKILRRIIEMQKSHISGNIIDMLDPKQYDEIKVCKNCYFVYNEQSKKKEFEPHKVKQIIQQKRYDKIIKEIDPETPAISSSLVYTQHQRLTSFMNFRAVSVSKLRVKNPSPFFQNILDSSFVMKRRKVHMLNEKVSNYLSHKKTELNISNSHIDKKLNNSMKKHNSFTSF